MICTYNAHKLASESSIEDLLMQASKIRDDIIGRAETRRSRASNAFYGTGEEMSLGRCINREVGGVGVLIKPL